MSRTTKKTASLRPRVEPFVQTANEPFEAFVTRLQAQLDEISADEKTVCLPVTIPAGNSYYGFSQVLIQWQAKTG